MPRAKRKVGFYGVRLLTENNAINTSVELNRILDYIDSLQNVAKKTDLTRTKFCFLEQSTLLNDNTTLRNAIFKCATHSYRAPLLDNLTVTERPNPKTMREGELVKTHCVFKYHDNGSITILIELFRGGINARQVIAYLNFFKSQYEAVNNSVLGYSFGYDIILKDNFEEELERLTRVINATIFVDKQILAGPTLNFADRIETVQEDIEIKIKAKKRLSVREAARQIFARLNGGNVTIHKIRLEGKNENNHNVFLDTTSIEKTETVEVDLNPDTGEISSQEILPQFYLIANNI